LQRESQRDLEENAMPSGPAPKTDGERRRRNESTFEWTILPAEGRQGAAPDLPDLRSWSLSTVAWWEDLWSSPQAVAWDQTGRTLHRLAILFDDLVKEKAPATSISNEMRQLEDRHGLNPKALLQLRWRIADDAQVVAIKPKATRKQRLKVVDAG
jgi:hypothetical protein